jgi:hypothetical protein
MLERFTERARKVLVSNGSSIPVFSGFATFRK